MKNISLFEEQWQMQKTRFTIKQKLVNLKKVFQNMVWQIETCICVELDPRSKPQFSRENYSGGLGEVTFFHSEVGGRKTYDRQRPCLFFSASPVPICE